MVCKGKSHLEMDENWGTRISGTPAHILRFAEDDFLFSPWESHHLGNLSIYIYIFIGVPQANPSIIGGFPKWG